MDKKRYGPWAVIAGASEGTGASFARLLADSGINVVIISRNGSLLEDAAGAIRRRYGVQVRALALDLSRSDMLDQIRQATDDIEVGLVVFNVGSSYGNGPFLSASLQDALRTVQLNSMGQLSLAHHFGSKMVDRGRGGIVLMGSMAGNAGGASVVVYSAVKAFTQIFAEGLWAELKPHGVDVLCMVLGATDTPARARSGVQDMPGQIVSDPDDVVRQCLDNLANGPVLMPSHLEEGFRQLCSMPRRQAAEAMRDLLLGMQQH